LERRLAAILAADVVGYSRLIGVDEEGTLATFKALRVEFIEPLIAEYRGRLVKLMGDGFLVEFQSAVDAVKCAVAWQQGFAESEDAEGLKFRIGVNLGDIVIDSDDIFGDGVNIAARLESMAEPGGVCISGTMFDQVDGKRGHRRPARSPAWSVAIRRICRSSWTSTTSRLWRNRLQTNGSAAETTGASPGR
jgi:adenylate cyclase